MDEQVATNPDKFVLEPKTRGHALAATLKFLSAVRTSVIALFQRLFLPKTEAVKGEALHHGWSVSWNATSRHRPTPALFFWDCSGETEKNQSLAETRTPYSVSAFLTKASSAPPNPSQSQTFGLISNS